MAAEIILQNQIDERERLIRQLRDQLFEIQREAVELCAEAGRESVGFYLAGQLSEAHKTVDDIKGVIR